MQEGFKKIVGGVGGRRLVWLINLFLLFFLIQALVDLTWYWFDDSSQDIIVQPALQAPSASRVSAQVLAQKIANAHLFGHAQSVSLVDVPTIAPETKLNLILSGVIASKQQTDAVAIIAADTRAAEKSYSIDDRLPGGATLKEVYADRVIIESRGHIETLTLHRKKLSNKELSVK